MEHIQHIFFDLDNTLWDHRKNAYLTLQEIFIREKIKDIYQIDFEDFHREYFHINENLWALIRDGKITKEYLRKHRFYDSFLSFGINNFELSQTFEHNFLDEILQYNELVKGTLPLLEYLNQKGFCLHILSNGFQEVTHRKCELSGIKSFFKTITSADEINIRKPQPEIYQYAINKANALKTNSLMIGDDWIADIVGAKKFGIKTIYFDRFNDDIKDKNILKINCLEELIDIL